MLKEAFWKDYNFAAGSRNRKSRVMREKALYWTSLQISLLNSQMGKDWSLFSFLLPSLFQGEYPEIYIALEPSAWRPLFTLPVSPSFHSVPDLPVFDNTDLSKTILSETYRSSWQRLYRTSLQVFATAKIILGAKYLQSTEIKLKKKKKWKGSSHDILTETSWSRCHIGQGMKKGLTDPNTGCLN